MATTKSKERWTKDEDCHLVELWSDGRSVEEITRELGRSFASVKTRASHRGCLFDGPVDRTRWTPELDHRLVELWEMGKSYAEIGAVLGRTESSIQSRASRLNCGNRERPRRVSGLTADGKRPWTPEEDKKLAELRRQGRKMHEIATSLGRSVMSISGRIDTVNKHHIAPKTEKRKPRPCMRCQALFMSEGPGNRHCNPCREWLAEAA